MSTEPETLSFDEWKQGIQEYANEEENCIECEGTGSKECPMCGNDTDCCDECDGSGKSHAFTEYLKQRDRDVELWKKNQETLGVSTGGKD